jgi:hypothetical protein
MKRIFALLTVLAFVVAGTMAIAAEKAPAKAPEMQTVKAVNCCVQGQCKQVASEGDCTKAGGKVVKDCKDCK